MPLTFLSHQAPVLPLKMAAPRWTDGTALVIGSMAPDLAFGARGTRWYVEFHEFVGPFWLCIPLTVAMTWAVKRLVAPAVGPFLPRLGNWNVRDYARVADWRWPDDVRGYAVLFGSAFVGAFTHIVLDSVTHGFGFFVRHIEALREHVGKLPPSLGSVDYYVSDVLQLVLSVVGAVVTLALLWVIGRRRLLVTWHPDAPELVTVSRAGRAWIVAGTLFGLVWGVALAIYSREAGFVQAFIIRVFDLAFVGLVAGCYGALRTMSPVREPGGRNR